jgi:hypothetical protein
MRWCDEGAVFKKPPDTASEKMKQNQRPTFSVLCGHTGPSADARDFFREIGDPRCVFGAQLNSDLV